MRFCRSALAAVSLVCLSAAAGASPTGGGSAPGLEPADPALVRVRELFTAADGQLKAPRSPRFAALSEPTQRGTRFVVAWLMPALSPQERALVSDLAEALGPQGDARLASDLAAAGGPVTSSAWVEELAGVPLLLVAVSSGRRGVDKELELAVLEAAARLGVDAGGPLAGLARRTLSPLSRVVVEMHQPEAAGVAVRLPKPLRHVIERGDTLSEIAQSHGLELDTLVHLNGMDPNKPIHPGEELKLNAGAPRPKLYVAKSGDTLAKVAKHFGISEKALLDANRSDGRRLSPGQKLVLPR